ncbi:MAG: PTS cellobiose transporter subunit IIC [Symbiobacteriia bacterium]
MQKFINWLEKHFMPFAGRVAEQRHLQAVRDGLIVTMPFLIIGSFFLIFAFPPVPALAEMVKPYMGNLLLIVDSTFGIMALLATFGIGYSLAQKYKIDPVSGGAMSLVAFMVATPFKDGAIPLGLTGSKGLFVGILIAILAVEIQRWFIAKNIIIKMPPGVPPAVARSFAALLPGLATILVVWIVRLGLNATLQISLHDVVERLLMVPLNALGATLAGAIVAELAINLLWSAGIHGAAIVGGILGPIWLGLSTANQEAMVHGLPLPNTVTQQFFEIFIHMGGSGATFSLALMLVFLARSQQLKSIGRTAIWPGIFNINEPITFGMPIVMNPILIIPFILAPISATITTYVAMQTGLVAKAYALVPWTTPPILAGWLTTGHISGALLQLFNLILTGLIYYPFFRLWDSRKLEEETGVPASGQSAARVA